MRVGTYLVIRIKSNQEAMHNQKPNGCPFHAAMNVEGEATARVSHPHDITGAPSAMAARLAMATGGFPLRLRRLDAPDSRIESPSPPMRAPIHTFLCLECGEAMIAVGEERLLLHAGECALIPAGQSFAVLYYHNCVGYMGGFAVELLSEGQVGNVMRRSESLRGWKMVRATFGENEIRFVATILERLDAECRTERNVEIVRAYLAAFVAEIDRRSVAMHSPKSESGEGLSDRFVAMVFEASDRRASIGDYAERLGVSAGTLYRAVKRSTGKTPLAWIDEAVVSEAKALLSHTDLSVNEIAARVGILDPSYFSRFFRKQVGLTPIDFREKMKKSHQ